MALLKKQADLLSGNFYILEEPGSLPKRYLLGRLSDGTSDKSVHFGRFQTYDLQGSEGIEAPSLVLDADELLGFLKDASGVESPIQLNLSSSEKSSYFETFSKIEKLMETTELKKAVLYTKAVSESGEFISSEGFCSLMQKGLSSKNSGYLFGYYSLEKEKAVLGYTPEYILKTEEDGSLITTAVAGTKPKVELESCGWSKKLLREHDLVMKGVSASLGDQVEWGEVYNFEYGNLCHLRAEGQIAPEASVRALSEKLHPTPAVGSLPKGFPIDELGPEGRGHFGGYVECSAFERPFSLVTIRCFEWSGSMVQVCIGGGVLQESVFEEEWSELEEKIKTFKKIWGL